MEHKVHEEIYLELVEFGGIDSGDEFFLVFTNAFEIRLDERGEDSARWWRQVHSVGARRRRSESNGKPVETRQCGETSGHRLIGEMYPAIGRGLD